MERWVLIFLCVLLLGALVFLGIVLWGIQREGVAIRISGPIEFVSAPQEGRIAISIEGPVELKLQGPAEAGLEARIEGALFPRCEGGVLIPVRWNPFSGEVVWRCVPQGEGNVEGEMKSP